MASENYIAEKALQNMPKSIPFDVLEILFPIAKANICKIECSDGGSSDWIFL